MEYFEELLATLNEMSPYLLLGFFISGLLHIYVPKSLYRRFLNSKGIRSVLGAALIGIPMPLCSCGVLPTAMSLKKEGASDGATVSFLVGTPQTGIDSMLATYSLLGLPFMIIRPIAALFVAIFGGVLVDKMGAKSAKKVDYSKFKPVTKSQSSQSDDCPCGCSHNHTEHKERSFKAVLRYGFVDMMQDYGKWLVVGLLIAAAITALIPDSLFTLFKDSYWLNILIVLLISIPMYVCATGSVPIALSLIVKGCSPGAAFILLMVGPATNIASMVMLRKAMGMRRMLISLAAIIVGAVVCAFVIDFVLPQEWFSGIEPLIGSGHEHGHHEHCNHGPIWWQTTCSIIFIVLFLNATIRGWTKKSQF